VPVADWSYTPTTMSTESPDERWRRLLAKAGEEQDPVKVRALIEELNNLFAGQLDRIFEQDQQSRDEIPAQPTPSKNVNS